MWTTDPAEQLFHLLGFGYQLVLAVLSDGSVQDIVGGGSSQGRYQIGVGLSA